MSESYVTHVDAGYYVAGTRVSLDSIVYAFLAGQTAEAMAQSFPVLTLEQIYGAVAYYLARRQEIDEYLAAQRDDFEAKRAAARAADPMFYQRSWPPGAAHSHPDPWSASRRTRTSIR